MEPEDPNTVIDLREVKSNNSRTKFDVFWEEAKKYINEDLDFQVMSGYGCSSGPRLLKLVYQSTILEN